MDDLTLEILLDEARIRRVLVRYALALDEHDWAALDDVFLADATVGYQGIGDFHGRAAVVDVVRSALSACGRTQHMLGNFRIRIDGDEAGACCYVQAVHAGLGAWQGETMTVWGEYRDRLRRTPSGWRIARRELVIFHVAGDIGGTAISAGQ